MKGGGPRGQRFVVLLVALLAGAACGQSDLAGPTALPDNNIVGAQQTESVAIDTAEPTVQPDLRISKVSLTSTRSPNQTAAVTIKTAAKARCSITVTYNSGPSTAAGLVDKTADSAGHVTWSWKVGGRTEAGTYPIDILCSKGDVSGSLSLSFTVT